MKRKLLLACIPLLPLSAFGWDGWKLTAPPVGGDSVADGSAFSFAFDYRYRKNDDIFRGDSRIGNPNQVATEFHQFSLSGSYRMDENWLFTARIPFTDATRSERGQPDANINGLGDVSITAIYSPWASDDSPWSPLSFSAGFILPTGEARDNPLIGGVNPSVFQLGTGTTQFTLSASYFGEINEDWSYFTSANFTLPLYESSKDFRPAETFFFRAGMGHSFTDSLTAKLSLDLFHGERDEFLGNEIGDTGSTTLSLAPSLVYSINENLSASASVAIPVYRRVNETALAVGPLWSLGLSYSF